MQYFNAGKMDKAVVSIRASKRPEYTACVAVSDPFKPIGRYFLKNNFIREPGIYASNVQLRMEFLAVRFQKVKD
jgi:hypothetical protein